MRSNLAETVYYSPEEYLELERQAEYKSEYFDGEMFAMSGSSRQHNLITGNVYAALHRQLRGRLCEVYTSEMRVKVSKTGLYTYPDGVVVCDKPQFEDKELDTLLNPTLIVEVLSESTERYDRGKKFEHYRSIPSFKEYILISQDAYRIEQYVRQPDNRWLFSEITQLRGTVRMDSIQCELTVGDVYEKVEITHQEETVS